MRLVFFGTPEFAVPSLRALVEEGFDVAAVVTQPDKPKGRHHTHLVPSPIKLEALEETLPVLQPTHPNKQEFLTQLGELHPDLGVVVGYGHILKPALLELPPMGMINVHASLLPEFRGAAPIEYAILNGLEETGVSVMQLDDGMDTGPVMLQVRTPIAPDENAGELTTRLAELGALALIEALSLIATGAAESEPQDDSLASYARKLTPELARIQWDSNAETIARQVRALDPRVGARTTLQGRMVKLFGPRPADRWEEQQRPGEIVATNPALVVATGSGALQFLDVQPEGRPRMAAADWIRGRGAMKGDRFE
jgi:methionyl-tRNA formyltransferase